MKGENASPREMKMIPPVFSQIQAITRMRISTNDGIICMSQASSCSFSDKLSWKASSENMLTRSIARIQRILGAQ